MKQTVDITPHPRILQVLGEIEFKPWQCIAELIDNSVDEFIRCERLGHPIPNPIVNIAFGRDTVVVKDNGPGMTLEALELAVKAGWTSNERIGNLGLYGIGFNISTARLGSITKIWTTQSGEPQWYGLELNLKEMAQGSTFNLEVKTRPKTTASDSGTEVEINNIKDDWKVLFQKDPWIRSHITDKLSRIYGTMLRNIDAQPINFSLYINNKKVSAWEHCVWPSDWTVYKKSEGNVHPVIEIDQTFGKKYLLRTSGEIYDSPDGLNLADVVEIPERVYGWVGIQRYADATDFGIDILRYGRKIEIGNKDVFKWDDDDGNPITEYPIDDPRNRGRIVGEIHLDHGYVHYTKHRFEREHSSWKQLLLALRRNEPLTKRKEFGYTDVNNSPLGLLHRTFRRNSPLSGSQQTWSDILFIQDNDLAKKWAEKLRKGISEYLDLEKWKRELYKSMELKAPVESDETDEDDLLDAENNNEKPGSESESSFQPPVLPQRTPLPHHNFHVTDIGLSSKTYDFETYALSAFTDTETAPWRSRATAKGIYEIEVIPDHPAFNSTSLQLIDAVLAEIAYIIASEEFSIVGSKGLTFGDILFTLRMRYSKSDSLDANRLYLEIEEIRKHIAHNLAKFLDEERKHNLLSLLEPDDLQKIELAQARGPAGVELIDYITLSDLLQIIRTNQGLLFEIGCLNIQWTPPQLVDRDNLLEKHRKSIFEDVLFPIAELANFTSNSGIVNFSRIYLSLVRACINRLREFLTI